MKISLITNVCAMQCFFIFILRNERNYIPYSQNSRLRKKLSQKTAGGYFFSIKINMIHIIILYYILLDNKIASRRILYILQ